MTSTSTGPLADVSFSPSCSCRAAKIFGRPGSVGGGEPPGSPGPLAPGNPMVLSSGVKSRWTSNSRVNSVLSTTGEPNTMARTLTNSDMGTLPPCICSSPDGDPMTPTLPQGKPRGVPGGGGAFGSIVTQLPTFGGGCLEPPLVIVNP